MDRNYYYRILGLREDATPEQIKAAYEQRMSRLELPDYADDPEYVRKKKHQTDAAYRVLMGSLPPASNSQRKARFERFKDAVEDREGKDDFVESDQEEWEKRREKGVPKRSGRTLLGSAGSRKSAFEPAGKRAAFEPAGGTFTSQPAGGTFASRTGSGRRGKNSSPQRIIVIVAVVVIAAMVLSSLIGMGVDLISDGYDSFTDYGVSDYVIETADDMRMAVEDMDVYEMLSSDGKEAYEDDVIWNTDTEAEDGDVFDALAQFVNHFNVYIGSDLMEYVTNDADFYWENTDAACAEAILSWLGLPPFDVVAGCTDLFTNEPILSLYDYLSYLTSYAAAWDEEHNIDRI